MPVLDALSPVDRAYTYVLQRRLVTSVGVQPSLLAELTNNDVECLLMYSGTLDDISKWVVADLLVWGEEQAAIATSSRSGREFWDKRDLIWDELLKNCKSDISKHTAYNMAATARAYPWERRRHSNTTSFEHHRLLSGKEHDEQEYWLDMAEAGEWSVHQLRTHLYGNHDPLSPRIFVIPTPSIWPIERVEKEVYAAFKLPTQWDTIERIKQLINQVIEETISEQSQIRRLKS